MRRIMLIIAGLLALVLVAAPANASGNTFHFSERDRGADAAFSNFPVDTGPVPGVVYTDTFLTTAQSAVTSDGQKFSDKFVFIDQLSYKFDRRQNFSPVSDTFGFAGGADVILAVAKDLSSASLSATVSLTTCTFDRRFNETCADPTPGTVSGSWTATGPKTLENGTIVVHTKGLTEVSHFHGFFRDATATGQVNGSPAPGTLQYADIFNATSRDVCVGQIGCGM